MDPADVRLRAEALGQRHGLRIDYGAPEGFFVPPYTSRDAALHGGQAVPVDVDAMPRALDGIDAALAIYPAGFVGTLCKAIFVCGGLMLDGARAGGTFGPAWIILVAAARLGEAGIFDTCRLGVHHELSSLIWRKQPEVAVRWARLMPAGWISAKNNAEALEAATNELEEREDGFLSTYGATTAENDFNVYAETAFDAPTRLLAAAAKVPLVEHKAACLLDAYCGLDARFVDVFERLGLGGLRQPGEGASSFGSSVPLELPVGEVVRPPTEAPK